MTDSWLLSVLPLITLAALVWLVRLRSHSWFSPGALFAGLWLATLAPALLAASDFGLWAPGVVLIVLLVAMVTVPAILVERFELAAVRRQQTAPRPMRLGVLRAAVYLGSAAGVGAIGVLLAVGGRRLVDLALLRTWIDVGSEFSRARYVDDVSQPQFATILSVGSFLGSVVGGVLWTSSRGVVDRLAAVTPVIIGMAYAALLTVRAGILYPLTLFVSGAAAHLVYQRRPLQRLLQPRVLIVAALVPAGLAAAFVALQLSRGGLDDLSRLPEMFAKLRVYAFGEVPAFTLWARDHWLLSEPPRLGQRTFSGVFDLLGLHERERGGFSDFITLATGDQVNVYTLFRGLLEDFGVAAFALLFGLGGLAGRLYADLLRGKAWALPLLAAMLCTMTWSPLVSVLSFNAILVALALFSVVIFAASARRGGPGTLRKRAGVNAPVPAMRPGRF